MPLAEQFHIGPMPISRHSGNLVTVCWQVASLVAPALCRNLHIFLSVSSTPDPFLGGPFDLPVATMQTEFFELYACVAAASYRGILFMSIKRQSLLKFRRLFIQHH